jgi:SAM-dependent methyltransferase
MADLDAERWDQKYASRAEALPAVGGYLAELEPWLPTSGTALDLAGGTGRHALWLAERGLDVTLVDVSGIALERAGRFAAQRGLRLHVRRWDLDDGPPPGGPWTLVLCTHFFDPALMASMAKHVVPGGIVAWVHPTEINLERNAKPSRRFLAATGQVAAVLRDAGLQVLHDVESWVTNEDGGSQHLARVVARRCASGS